MDGLSWEEMDIQSFNQYTMQSLNRFSHATNGAVTVGATSTAVLPADGGRQYAIIINDSDETIYLGLGAAAAMNQGIRLNTNGGAFEISGVNVFTGAINAICASGSKVLTYVTSSK